MKEDKFYIREMDKLLADQGYVVRAKVRFWGPTQPESRQYFWKESTGFYDCSHDDPRKSKLKVSHEDELHVPSVTPKKKSQGPRCGLCGGRTDRRGEYRRGGALWREGARVQKQPWKPRKNEVLFAFLGSFNYLYISYLRW